LSYHDRNTKGYTRELRRTCSWASPHPELKSGRDALEA
jgi:hypothetical protein